MKLINLTYVLLAAIPLVQTVVEAGSYTLDACMRTDTVHVWDSDGGYGQELWDGKTSNTVYVGVKGSGFYSKMKFNINKTKKTATITYRGQTLKFSKPNNEIWWKD
ncbi:hypothetical protein BGZ97_007171, partial [Linnemannia gamsii]